MKKEDRKDFIKNLLKFILVLVILFADVWLFFFLIEKGDKDSKAPFENSDSSISSFDGMKIVKQSSKKIVYYDLETGSSKTTAKQLILDDQTIKRINDSKEKAKLRKMMNLKDNIK